MEFVYDCRVEDGNAIVTVGLAGGRYVALCGACLVTVAIDDWDLVVDGLQVARFVPLTSEDIRPGIIAELNAAL